LVNLQSIAAGQRTIARRGHPFLAIPVKQPGSALEIGQLANASRRIILRKRRSDAEARRRKQRERQQPLHQPNNSNINA
jgi:hypothetical protein